MNRDIMEGQWKQARGRFRIRWGKLMNDERMQIEGDYEMLCGRIQKAYGLSQDSAGRKSKRVTAGQRRLNYGEG